MSFHHESTCLVFLIGHLNSMPMRAENQSDENMIIVTRERHCFKTLKLKKERYRVIINNDDAKKIVMHGFLGISLSVRGDLRTDKKTEIIAEQIDFINFPNTNQSQAALIHHVFQNAKREQYSYLH